MQCPVATTMGSMSEEAGSAEPDLWRQSSDQPDVGADLVIGEQLAQLLAQRRDQLRIDGQHMSVGRSQPARHMLHDETEAGGVGVVRSGTMKETPNVEQDRSGGARYRKDLRILFAVPLRSQRDPGRPIVLGELVDCPDRVDHHLGELGWKGVDRGVAMQALGTFRWFDR